MNKNLEKQLLQLFNSIRPNKDKQAPVQRSTLYSLLLYHKIDTTYPQYFRYISRQLQKINKATINEGQFLKIFMNPEIQLETADKDELADVFSILDNNKTGTIQMNDFLAAYRNSENYLRLTQAQRRQAQDQIKQAFYSVSEDGNITPLQFYNIVKFK